MAHLVESNHHATLADYERVAHLSGDVRELRRAAERLSAALAGRRVWMVNSTARGGGVAELLPPLLALMRELGVDANWLVMETDEPRFFVVTKHLHNLIHGEGDPHISREDRELYRDVSERAAAEIGRFVRPGDVVVVHDPQPLGAGALLRRRMDIVAVWRCHIGLDRETPQTRAAWEFLEEWLPPYDHSVFTAPEYIPRCLAGRASIIHPSIDPLSDKNKGLPVHGLVGILANGCLIEPSGPVPTPRYADTALRLQRDARWLPANEPEDFGLLFRPIVTQVSRWDRLKGYVPLLKGFAKLKRDFRNGAGLDEALRPSLELVRLVLAGPDPASVADDPEGHEALQEIIDTYLALEPELQEEIAIISLPMSSRHENALLVNALQRCSDIVVQNSLHEGFGLTVTEAMWKRAAVLGSSSAGIRQQIRAGLDGRLVKNPEDADEIARTLRELLTDQPQRTALGLSAQQRVHDEFLVFAHVRRWLELTMNVVEARWGNGETAAAEATARPAPGGSS